MKVLDNVEVVDEQVAFNKRAIYNLNGNYAESMVPAASVGPNAYSARDIASAAAPSASMKAVLRAQRNALESAKASHLSAFASAASASAASASASAASVPAPQSIVSLYRHLFTISNANLF
jgi:hypothetical protein